MWDLLFSILPSLIAVIGVIGAPIFSAKQAHKHELRMYDKKFIIEHKIKSIESYLENVGRFLFSEQTISMIYIYAPKELWEQIDKMNETVLTISSMIGYDQKANYYKVGKKQYIELCKAFSAISSELPDGDSKMSTKK